ncbi:MAG: Tol-Pal system beta propeller repeat protein TolB [Thermodesulfovibrionales bacterium]
MIQRRKNCCFTTLLFYCSVVLLLCCSSALSWAKVYIDITSPAIKKLPIAISDFEGPYGKEISDIIRYDLDFSGLFDCLDSRAIIEKSSQPFNQRNWSALGAEIAVKGISRNDNGLSVLVSVYDVTEIKEIFRKEYRAGSNLLRPLAHSISNDIYKQFTGQDGIFRTRIAYVIRHKDHDSLNIMDWDGYRSFDSGVKGSVILTPRWSRGGDFLLYSAERNREWNIYLLDLKRALEKKVFSASGTNMAGDIISGNEILLSSTKDGNPDIFLYNVAETRLKRLTSLRGIEVSPAISPDGKSIVFVSNRDGTPQLFVMDRDGYNIRRLTFQGSYNTSPSWSPKGDKIVFSGRVGGKNQIFTINPDGSNLTQLTDSGNNEDPCFSPDGRYIVFTSDRDGGKAIYIMRANGEAQRRITPKGIRASSPRWAPN